MKDAGISSVLFSEITSNQKAHLEYSFMLKEAGAYSFVAPLNTPCPALPEAGNGLCYSHSLHAPSFQWLIALRTFPVCVPNWCRGIQPYDRPGEMKSPPAFAEAAEALRWQFRTVCYGVVPAISYMRCPKIDDREYTSRVEVSILPS